MVRRQEKFLSSRRSAMAKTASNSFYLETLSFFPLFLFLLFAMQKSWGHALPRPSFPGVVGPDYIPKGQHGIEF